MSIRPTETIEVECHETMDRHVAEVYDLPPEQKEFSRQALIYRRSILGVMVPLGSMLKFRHSRGSGGGERPWKIQPLNEHAVIPSAVISAVRLNA